MNDNVISFAKSSKYLEKAKEKDYVAFMDKLSEMLPPIIYQSITEVINHISNQDELGGIGFEVETLNEEETQAVAEIRYLCRLGENDESIVSYTFLTINCQTRAIEWPVDAHVCEPRVMVGVADGYCGSCEEDRGISMEEYSSIPRSLIVNLIRTFSIGLIFDRVTFDEGKLLLKFYVPHEEFADPIDFDKPPLMCFNITIDYPTIITGYLKQFKIQYQSRYKQQFEKEGKK